MTQTGKGFTLIEVVIVLAVVAILGAVLTPLISQHIEDSRLSKASSDVNTIGTAITTFYKDVGIWPADADGDLDGNDLQGLRSGMGSAAAGSQWETYASGVLGDTFGNQLMSNTIRGNGAWFYNRGRWHGPYMSKDGSDPWGRRYYCNVLVGYAGTGAFDFTTMMVISAGTDGTIQTPVGSGTGTRATVNIDANDVAVMVYGRQNW